MDWGNDCNGLVNDCAGLGNDFLVQKNASVPESGCAEEWNDFLGQECDFRVPENGF